MLYIFSGLNHKKIVLLIMMLLSILRLLKNYQNTLRNTYTKKKHQSKSNRHKKSFIHAYKLNQQGNIQTNSERMKHPPLLLIKQLEMF